MNESEMKQKIEEQDILLRRCFECVYECAFGDGGMVRVGVPLLSDMLQYGPTGFSFNGRTVEDAISLANV